MAGERTVPTPAPEDNKPGHWHRPDRDGTKPEASQSVLEHQAADLLCDRLPRLDTVRPTPGSPSGRPRPPLNTRADRGRLTTTPRSPSM